MIFTWRFRGLVHLVAFVVKVILRGARYALKIEFQK
jgi:hypothetical protein